MKIGSHPADDNPLYYLSANAELLTDYDRLAQKLAEWVRRILEAEAREREAA